MSYSQSSSHDRHRRTIKSSNIIPFKIFNEERVDNLLSMIIKAHTTSILHQLEYHRGTLSRPAFRILLLLLTTELNSATWTGSPDNPYTQPARRRISKRNNRWQITSKDDVDQCCRIIFYYIVSVINKYKLPSTENLWVEILGNSLTQNKQFYEYLYENKIILPNETCKKFSEKLNLFYSSQSDAFKIKLIGLGFIFDKMITFKTRIKDLEKIFFQLKQREKSNSKIDKPEKFISFMNTPEKLSLFLSHFPDYDINQVDKQTNLNVLEQLINMKPYFYLPQVNTSNRFTRAHVLSNKFIYKTPFPFENSQFDCHPNEKAKYRSARIINLLQQLICRGARLSQPVYSDILSIAINEYRFFTTSLGMYVLIDLYMNDLYPSKSSLQHDYSFISFIIKYIKRFQPEFQEFILHRLTLSYSIIHQPEFIIQQRENEDEQSQEINDKLFQRSLKLKEWCRLKIKNNCLQKNIKQLKLTKSLVNYCSFDFFEPNYALQCIKEVVRHRGNVTPEKMYRLMKMNSFDDDDNEQMISDIENDHSGMVVNIHHDSDDYY